MLSSENKYVLHMGLVSFLVLCLTLHLFYVKSAYKIYGLMLVLGVYKYINMMWFAKFINHKGWVDSIAIFYTYAKQPNCLLLSSAWLM